MKEDLRSGSHHHVEVLCLVPPDYELESVVSGFTLSRDNLATYFASCSTRIAPAASGRGLAAGYSSPASIPRQRKLNQKAMNELTIPTHRQALAACCAAVGQ